ncbi:MAG: methylmalonyl-CoA mutase [Gammaproteobacteria bacterium]|nr:methylmalonyl-CoA mutase [Gammaproteobacteria bacterium]NIR82533.1 methylmalonyl-CoA mutase [Gammaproteobacteria bacterium]NIR88359.1 methylmalonyl-CoA mutase [Gammaproteobacteria bacterium]NIU03671.1 methylmalonyl-CoA mutase [Gammaproteobacteria bacterium]NIV52885.1 methylmalonyl-CoA mutase [Gammaproteobacteria bacterium]
MFDDDTLKKSREAQARWQAGYDKLRERFGDQAPPQAQEPQTRSGLPLRNCYFPHDTAHLDFSHIGAPGSYPFTRGNLPAQYQFMAWANQPVIGYGLPEHTRERMDRLAQQGMVGYFGNRFYNLVYDLVSHEGLDPDHRAARGRIGQCGMAVYSVRDMERLFAGLDPTQMNVVHITYYQVIPALAQYIAYAERCGVEPAALRGNSMNWYHQSAYVGMSAFPPEQGLKLAVELVSYCSKHMPRWNTTNFFCYGVEEAGGTAVQEMGLLLAFGVELVAACVEAGLAPDRFLPRFGFQVAQSNDFFEEIAKIRALRRLWATTMHERFGAQDPRSMHVRIHTHTSGAMLTAQQPLVNLIRTTLHALGAVLAGTQAMEVSAYDEALAIPTEEAATLALRVQQVIREETNVTAVSDPLAGSWYLESLTDQIAQAAQRLVDEVQAQGGYIAAQRSGWIRSQVETSAQHWREKVNSGEWRVVGLNCHQVDEEPEVPMFKVDPEVERIAVARVRELRETRDPHRWQQAMAAFEEAARRFAAQEVRDLGDDALMHAAIEAARADATTGEMMGVLKDALGWGPPHEF